MITLQKVLMFEITKSVLSQVHRLNSGVNKDITDTMQQLNRGTN